MRNKRRNIIKSVQRRLEVEITLSEYPNLSADRIVDLMYWFKREATALEVATIASNPAIQKNYRQFRDTHLERLSAREVVLATGLGVILIVTVAVIIVLP